MTTREILERAKAAAATLSTLTTAMKNAALQAMADALMADTAPILSANGQSHPKTEVQKSFGLETGSPIGSRESRGWPGSSSSELPKAATLGRGFRYGQSGHGICWDQQRAELVQQQG